MQSLLILLVALILISKSEVHGQCLDAAEVEPLVLNKLVHRVKRRSIGMSSVNDHEFNVSRLSTGSAFPSPVLPSLPQTPKTEPILQFASIINATFDASCAQNASMIQTSVLALQTMITKMHDTVNNRKLCGPVYRKYFSPSEFATVQGMILNLSKIDSIRFTCGGKYCSGKANSTLKPANIVAYSLQNSPSPEMVICPRFYTLKPIGGYDTQAGTFVHELSHLKSVGHAEDFVYGNIKAQSLAKSDPTKASKNADSFEYYGESLNF